MTMNDTCRKNISWLAFSKYFVSCLKGTIAAQFDEIDVNNSGRISYKEFSKALQGVGATNIQLKALYENQSYCCVVS